MGLGKFHLPDETLKLSLPFLWQSVRELFKSDHMKHNARSQSDTTALYVLITMIGVFVVLVANGWSKFLLNEPLFASYPILAYLGGLAVAGIGVILAKGVASERLRISAEADPKFKNTWLAYFFVLFIFSSIGTMNFLFTTFRATNTVEDTIGRTVLGLRELEIKCKAALPTPELDKKRIVVRAIFDRFSAEIRNPVICGMGAVSLKHFNDLKQALPNLIQPANLGSGQNCSKVDDLVKSYGIATENALKEWVNVNLVEERSNEGLLNKFESNIRPLVADLERIQAKQAKGPDEYRPALTKAWNAYKDMLSEAEQKSKRTLDAPRTLEDPRIADIGRFITVLILLLSQWSDPMSYLIFSLAILVDVVLIMAYGRHLVTSLSAPQRFEFSLDGSNTSTHLRNPLDQ